MVLPKGGIDDGYDLFIGRELFENGDEYLVTVSLQSQACNSYWTLEQACEELCNSVKEGKSVLLSQNPNRAGATYKPFRPEQLDLLQRLYARREEMKRFPDTF